MSPSVRSQRCSIHGDFNENLSLLRNFCIVKVVKAFQLIEIGGEVIANFNALYFTQIARSDVASVADLETKDVPQKALSTSQKSMISGGLEIAMR